jgi:pyrrolidone-carboxylate peptidase
MLQLHLGVNSGAARFAIERLAANEATFRCSDELGWQPQVSYDLASGFSLIDEIGKTTRFSYKV